ncbi:MAG: cytochrome c oxidase subunit 3 [Gammaproteobacteria bacterium]|nr:cytochrome c oxidase subunit 3 [Gammaproteobacteria bacterium]
MSEAIRKYYVPHGSAWPIIGSVSLFLLAFGAGNWLNDGAIGRYMVYAGTAGLLYMVFGWFGEVIRESVSGIFGRREDSSFRQGMIWFIMSEVMFFAGFFGALFYARQLAIPWLGGEGANIFTNLLLWSGFEPAWPTNGPGGLGGTFEPMPWKGLPLINTALLLTSSVTITIAHHALIDGNRKLLKWGLAATFVLGFLFLGLQVEEYYEAYVHLNLKLSTGIYGSTFFMLTGFHGAHVTLGSIMLVVIWLRVLRGHFTPTHHFGFEAVAWYWHFVDVVWLGLFIFVYIL